HRSDSSSRNNTADSWNLLTPCADNAPSASDTDKQEPAKHCPHAAMPTGIKPKPSCRNGAPETTQTIRSTLPWPRNAPCSSPRKCCPLRGNSKTTCGTSQLVSKSALSSISKLSASSPCQPKCVLKTLT